MEFLVLSQNDGITGTIPESIGDLALLKELLLDRCPWLSGSIPSSFTKLQSLEFLSLWNNNLTGTLPQDLFTSLPSLEVIQLFSNSLSGTIPEFFPRGPLERIKIGDNLFTGTIPSSIYELRSLKEFTVDGGYLTGTISSLKISNLVNNLETLGLCCNHFQGTIPTQFGLLGRLTTLDVSYNNMEGTIPTQLGNLFRSKPISDDYLVVNGLWLNDNLFTGSIPSELGRMLELGGIDLSYNMLTGTVPIQLGNLPLLRENYIGLNHNNLTGSLNDIFCNNEPFPPVNILKADCDELECGCCTDCCDMNIMNNNMTTTSNSFGYYSNATTQQQQQCVVNVPVVCDNKASQIMYYFNPPEWGTICECSSSSSGNDVTTDDATDQADADEVAIGKAAVETASETVDTVDTNEFVYLSCADTGCVSCNLDGKGCVENIDYGYMLPVDTGFDNLYHCTMRYVDDDASSNNYQTVTYRIDLYELECDVFVDDVKCNSCLEDRRCSDGYTGRRIDCSNVMAGAIYDDCDPTLDGGKLLEFFNPEYYEQEDTSCYPCIY